VAKDTKEMLEIRQGLVQYIGAMADRISYSGAEARQVLCAIIVEEALKLVTVNEKVELYSAKPILRAANVVLSQRIQEYDEVLRNGEVPSVAISNVSSLRDELLQVQSLLRSFIDKITKEDGAVS
jgi:hypothetical protein